MAITIISRPSGLCFSGNLPKLTLTASADVRIRLLAGNTTLLDETYTPDFNQRISLDLSEIVHNALTFTIPTADTFIQAELVKTFTIMLDNASYTFTAIRTGVKRLNVTPSVFLAKNFLTWQPQAKAITGTQPEWLTCYAAQACYLYVTAELANHSVVSKKITNLTAGNACTVNTGVERIAALAGARPVRYDVYAVATDNPSALRLSMQLYHVVENTNNEQFYCFQNSLGGLDTVRCTGAVKHAPEYTSFTALMNDVEDTYYIEKKDLTVQRTGWLDIAARAWLHDFFTAKQRYKYGDEALQPVVIDEVTAETSTAEDLIAFEFTYREAIASIYLNLKRDGIITTCTWADYVNVLAHGEPAFTCTWSDYVNVLEGVCINAYSHAYSRAYNCTSPEAPFLKVSPETVWLPQVDPRAELNVESNTDWHIE